MKARIIVLAVVAALATIAFTGSASAAPSGGLTASQQVAYSEATSGATLDAMTVSATGGGCWTETATESFGTWPYEQNVHLHTNWCGSGTASSGGYITYWSSYVTTSSTICSASNTYHYKMWGGVGSTYVAVEGGSYFSCQIAPLWSIHNHVYIQMQYGPGGGIWVLGGGG
jgi:type II secretory pathway pseudopilin PulG